MQEMNAVYRELGISSEVLAYGNKIEQELKERFAAIDDNAEYNQMKVLLAMQKNKVSEACLYASSGYGYNDLGRDTLEVYMQTHSTRRQHWYGPRSPAAPMPLRLLFPATCAPVMNSSPLWASHMTPWRRSSASARPEAPWQNTESPTDRRTCFLTAALIMKTSKRPLMRRQNWSRSSAPKDTRPVPHCLWNASEN